MEALSERERKRGGGWWRGRGGRDDHVSERMEGQLEREREREGEVGGEAGEGGMIMLVREWRHC